METNDQNTTLADVKNWVQRFCEERDWDPYHSPKDLAIGLATESSELLELFRFVRERELKPLMDDPSQRQKMADELADSLYFILRFAQLYHFDLSECMRNKMVKNAQKYPAPQK
ncbi:MAG: nucleotide pyrophosphohydrolase [Bdellovibrionales bacterium]|nr:nucleotide pyrophosphohydrolase [Bdellovibrionales bacterium]